MSKKSIDDLLGIGDRDRPNRPEPEDIPGSGDFSEHIPRDLPNKLPDVPAMFEPDEWPDPPPHNDKKN